MMSHVHGGISEKDRIKMNEFIGIEKEIMS